jgi:hypothetical protein
VGLIVFGLATSTMTRFGPSWVVAPQKYTLLYLGQFSQYSHSVQVQTPEQMGSDNHKRSIPFPSVKTECKTLSVLYSVDTAIFP